MSGILSHPLELFLCPSSPFESFKDTLDDESEIFLRESEIFIHRSVWPWDWEDTNKGSSVTNGMVFKSYAAKMALIRKN